MVSYSTTLFLGKPTKAVYQYEVPILLSADNLLFLNQRKNEKLFPRKNVPDASVDLETAAYKADTLPTKLTFPVLSVM